MSGRTYDPELVKSRVDEIRQMAGDPEIAHNAEDELYQDLLQAIAEGRCDNHEACAAEALKAGEISFSRWYA